MYKNFKKGLLGKWASLAGILITVPLGYSGEFWEAREWSTPKAEIARYEGKKVYLGRELAFEALFVTEGVHYFSDGRVERAPGKGSRPALNFSINYNLERDSLVNRPVQGDWLFLKTAGLPLIRQRAALLGLENPVYRELSAPGGGPTLEIRSRRSPKIVTSLPKSPVYTPEQLFVFLRSLPLDKQGHKEKIWIMGSLLEEVLDPRIQFAEIEVREKRVLLDKPTRYITVIREDGKKFEFFLEESGLHQVILARYPDKSTFQLKGMEFRRYWFFN